jgi:hypothetical protein
VGKHVVDENIRKAKDVEGDREGSKNDSDPSDEGVFLCLSSDYFLAPCTQSIKERNNKEERETNRETKGGKERGGTIFISRVNNLQN